MIKFPIRGIIFLLLLGCATTPNNKSILALRKLTKSGQFDKALILLNSDKEIKQKKNKLLFFLNQGSLFHLKKDYLNATIAFQKTITIIDKLYTKKISNKVATFVSNEKADIYYGEKFEHSMVYFYLALDYYQLFKINIKTDSKKAQEYKNKARASLRGWNSFLDELRRDRVGNSIFKRDLAQHLVGAALHQVLGSREDLQIALVLYQNVFDVLKKSYNAYPSFNLKWKDYVSNYSKLKKLKQKELLKYINESNYQKKLKNYVRKRLLILARKINYKRFKTVLKKIRATKEEIKYVKENYKKKTLFIVSEDGLMPSKIAQKHYFGVNEVLRDPSASSTQKAVAQVGGVVLAIFAAKTLGMLPHHNQAGYYDHVRARAGYDLTAIATNEISLGFELPMIKFDATNMHLSFEYKYKNKKKNFSSEFVLVNPIGDLATEAVEEHSSAIYKKLIFRLTTKHLTAILAAYATYKAISKKDEPNFFAKTAAIFGYMAATKIINNSEQADLRFWGLLPKSIQMAAIDYDFLESKLTVKDKKRSFNLIKSSDLKSEVIYLRSF